MKILYLDFLCPKGHLTLDVNQINRLSSIGEVFVISQKGRYKQLPANVKNIEKASIEIKPGKLRNRLSSLKIMLISALECRKIEYDYIFVSSFETIMFAIGRLFFRKRDKIVIVHHFNTDELSNKIKAFIFRTYMRKVKHIVLSELIKEHLFKDFDIDPNNIFVLPHHMNKIKIDTYCKKEYRCVGLSNSNDDEIISEIIQMEKEKGLFKHNKLKVVLKSQKYEFDNNYLKVIKGFLEKPIFDSYIDKAQSIYMPFPSNFKYRMSGTLIDALTNNKVVYGSDIPVMREYSSKYPNICKIVKGIDDFIGILLEEDDNSERYAEEFAKFRQDHSEERIESILSEVFTTKWEWL